MRLVRTIVFQFGGARECLVTAELEGEELAILSIREISTDLELDTERTLDEYEPDNEALFAALFAAFL